MPYKARKAHMLSPRMFHSFIYPLSSQLPILFVCFNSSELYVELKVLRLDSDPQCFYGFHKASLYTALGRPAPPARILRLDLPLSPLYPRMRLKVRTLHSSTSNRLCQDQHPTRHCRAYSRLYFYCWHHPIALVDLINLGKPVYGTMRSNSPTPDIEPLPPVLSLRIGFPPYALPKFPSCRLISAVNL
jgi:hypothetical protein